MTGTHIQYGLKCPACGDVIYSNSRHDFEWCECEGVFIDGGWDYMRFGGEHAFAAERVSRSVNREDLPYQYRDEKRGLQPTPA